ncbi:hypothetical protein FQN57_007321 [Myotisia sp. PD_48]|nr:hypothetical protein FQN57_007321 [Myotisia sp. PD_48]
MLLENPSPAISTAAATALFSPVHALDERWARSRRRTDPLIIESPQVLTHRTTRHSIDSPSKLINSHYGDHLPAAKHSSSLSSLSSDRFSDPTLANFSPLKTGSLVNSPSQQPLSSIPTLQLQTPQTSRGDSALQSLSVAANTASSSSSDCLPACTSPLSPVSPPVINYHRNPGPSSKEPRSPHQKRAPASRSSHGIETSSGPPPALSTRQQNIAPAPEGVRRIGRHALTTPQRSSNTESSTNSPGSGPKSKIGPQTGSAGKNRISLPVKAGLSMQHKDKSVHSGRQGSAVQHSSTRADSAYTDVSSSKGSMTEKSEDLFLNIAQTSSRRNSTANPERRRSKFGLAGLASRSRTVEATPSPEPTYPDRLGSSFSQDNSPLGAYSGSSLLRSPTSSHPLDEPGRRLRFFGGSRSTVGSRSKLSQINRELSPESSHVHTIDRRDSAPDSTQSRLSSNRVNRGLSIGDGTEAKNADSVERPRHDGTESTLSTTAPSTVWDELDDLKSRIRKLELTGKFPSSSAAAMSSISVERPRTATTTITTLSSSPKHNQKINSHIHADPDPTLVPERLHPLLHTALAKNKPILNPEVFRTLEAAATEAIDLVAMLSPNASQLSGNMSVVNGSVSSDRQLRRKADSLCRTLTELCVALSDDQLSKPQPRPSSRDATSTNSPLNGIEIATNTPIIRYRKSGSHEFEEPGRIHTSFSRETGGRRTSIFGLSANINIRETPQEASEAQASKLSTPLNRLSRSSATLRARRHDNDEDDEIDDKSLATSRPISRAMTDINYVAPNERSHPREQASRVYCPDYQSGQHDSSPHVHTSSQSRATPNTSQSSIPLRRTYMSTTTNIPTTSHVTIQPGFHRYSALVNSGSPAARTINEDANDSPRDEYPVQQPRNTGRAVSHFSSLQQFRPRTNSVGTRRLGSVRSRPLGAMDDDP